MSASSAAAGVSLSQPDPDAILADEIARFEFDPLGYVLFVFDWGHGDLAGDTRHPRLTPILQAASTAFLRRHLTGDANAAAWLQQALPAMLDGDDRLDMRAPGR